MIMRSDRRLLLTSLAAVAAASLSASNAYALMCPIRTFDDWITEAEVIFRGRLMSREPLKSVEPTSVSRLNDPWTVIHAFEALEVLKGELGETVSIYEPHGVYGSNIRPGQILLVFAEREESACSSSQTADTRKKPARAHATSPNGCDKCGPSRQPLSRSNKAV